MSRSDLHRLISPKSIAVVGNRGADFAIKESKKLGFNHQIWSVHPTLDSLEGIQCYRDIKDLPEAPDATFIATQDKAQEVKAIVECIQANGREESVMHRKVYRPWGWYDSIEIGKLFQVKRLHVNPGAKLSLQMHKKRAEHWVVVDGEASVTNGDKIFTLTKGESTYIPLGVTHSLENKTSQILEIIEVQSGSYLGEDDIVRFEDRYGRNSK